MQTINFDETWSTARRRDAMVDLLKGMICEVTFTKVNGETRVMPCTLDPKWLPPAPIMESQKKPNPATLSVWCTDKKEWRSFRLDNVKSIRQLHMDLGLLSRIL